MKSLVNQEIAYARATEITSAQKNYEIGCPKSNLPVPIAQVNRNGLGGTGKQRASVQHEEQAKLKEKTGLILYLSRMFNLVPIGMEIKAFLAMTNQTHFLDIIL